MLNELEMLLEQLNHAQQTFEVFEYCTINEFECLKENQIELLVNVLNEMQLLVEEQRDHYQSLLETEEYQSIMKRGRY